MGAFRDMVERSNIYVAGVLERKEREYGQKHI